MHEIQSQSLFLWYDYFLCPQLEPNKADVTNEKDGSCLARAIKSIPAHITHARFFIALCPVLDCAEQKTSSGSWSPLARGAAAAWCGGAGSTWCKFLPAGGTGGCSPLVAGLRTLFMLLSSTFQPVYSVSLKSGSCDGCLLWQRWTRHMLLDLLAMSRQQSGHGQAFRVHGAGLGCFASRILLCYPACADLHGIIANDDEVQD
eukprot:s3946_g10.t1